MELIKIDKYNVSIKFTASKNFTPLQKNKIEEAIKQFRIKSNKNIKKLQRRVKRIIEEEKK